MNTGKSQDYRLVDPPVAEAGSNRVQSPRSGARAPSHRAAPRLWSDDDGFGRFSSDMLRARLVQRPNVYLYRRYYDLFKRLFDVCACLLLMPFVLPVLSICAVFIWLDDPGRIVFTQWRTGRGGRRFRIYKFRTMVTNAEELKQKYAHLNELTWPDFKITNDPRVTRVGRILRKTSLDELPQLLNVLIGDMSLVGPRPTSFDVSTYALWHTERLEVVPGITGLWQIRGRSDLDFDERLRLDIEYIQNRTFWLDLKILFQTFTVFFSQRGAY